MGWFCSSHRRRLFQVALTSTSAACLAEATQAIGLRIAAVGQIDRAGLGGRPIQPFALIETGNASIGHPAGRWIKSQMQAKGPKGPDDADPDFRCTR